MDRAKKEDMIIKQGASASPEPDAANGRRGSDVSMSSSAAPVTDENWRTARERKVAIFNLPDTVNNERIQAAMEKHGPLTKIQIRRQDGGAIVEFADVQDAFNVRQGVDCSVLGSEVKTGEVAELLAKVRKRQGDASNASKPGESKSGEGQTWANMAPPSIVRPSQRGGRRGGLGFKRGGALGLGAGRSEEVGGSGARSNSDFRSMFVKAKETESEAKESED